MQRKLHVRFGRAGHVVRHGSTLTQNLNTPPGPVPGGTNFTNAIMKTKNNTSRKLTRRVLKKSTTKVGPAKTVPKSSRTNTAAEIKDSDPKTTHAKKENGARH